MRKKKEDKEAAVISKQTSPGCLWNLHNTGESNLLYFNKCYKKQSLFYILFLTKSNKLQ